MAVLNYNYIQIKTITVLLILFFSSFFYSNAYAQGNHWLKFESAEAMRAHFTYVKGKKIVSGHR